MENNEMFYLGKCLTTFHWSPISNNLKPFNIRAVNEPSRSFTIKNILRHNAKWVCEHSKKT